MEKSYNSVVFASRSASMYGVYQFSPNRTKAIETGTFNYSAGVGNYGMKSIAGWKLYESAFRANKLQRLEPLECINAYGVDYQSSWGNVYLMHPNGTKDYNDNGSNEFPTIEEIACGKKSGVDWIFNQFGTSANDCWEMQGRTFLAQLREDVSIWEPFAMPVDHCLAEPVQEHCKLQFSSDLLAIVIVFNFLKCLAIVMAIWALQEKPLLTIGDAISTFLRHPDDKTQNTVTFNPQQEKKRMVQIRWWKSVKKGKLWACIVA